MSQSNYYAAELIERIDVSANLAVFRFRPEVQLSFAAGQYSTIGVAINGGVIERPYSIVSSPYEPFLEFFVELVPGGVLTPKLWELKLGSSILVRRRVVGQFSVNTHFNRHLMLATVTGVAPFISILRTQQTERARGARLDDRFLVIHGASRSCDFGPYLGELDELSRSGWLNYVPTISRPWKEPDWKGETGRLEDVVRKHADRLGFGYTNTAAYACGHPGMVENVKGILARARFPKEQIREEEYFKLHDSRSAPKQALPVDQNSMPLAEAGDRAATRPVLS
ncbi:MAG TPA: FAD-binding oxidoreductase [Pyrinomonadaceae bacterium]|nr:FAD-binding oxidoreductase [Pyrinomonadaceae bacterium]